MNLQSIWNVTRWYGTNTARKGRRIRGQRGQQGQESGKQSGVRLGRAEEQRNHLKVDGMDIQISTEPGNYQITRRKLAFLMDWVQSKVAGNLDLYKWRTETMQECLRWLQAVMAAEERTADIVTLEQMMQERLRIKRSRMTHEAQSKKKGGLLNFI